MMMNGGMSRSVVTALLIGCLVFGVLLGLIGTKGSSSSPSGSNLREGTQMKERAAKATESLEAIPSGDRKQLDPMMLPRAFNKAEDHLEAGEDKGDWNEVFGADEEFKAFDHLIAKDEEMSFMFSYEMETWD